METLPTKALSKGELNRRNDKKAARRYRRRMELDQQLADMRLARELREVWQT